MSRAKRTVMVTGASSGIGEQVVKRLLAEGNNVIGIARNFNKTSLAAHDQYQTISLDFSDLQKLEQSLKAMVKRHDEVTDVVCSAGQGRFGSLEEFSYEQIRELLHINFVSQAYVVRAFMPLLKRRGSGNIIFIGSEAALSGGRKGAIYCASKFALRGFAQSLREECAATGVRVGLVNPGMVSTPFFGELDFTHGEQPDNYIEPEDVADAIVWMLNSRQHMVVDELNLSPLKKVIVKKAKDT